MCGVASPFRPLSPFCVPGLRPRVLLQARRAFSLPFLSAPPRSRRVPSRPSCCRGRLSPCRAFRRLSPCLRCWVSSTARQGASIGCGRVDVRNPALFLKDVWVSFCLPYKGKVFLRSVNFKSVKFAANKTLRDETYDYRIRACGRACRVWD